jgi:hypothetical protein
MIRLNAAAELQGRSFAEAAALLDADVDSDKKTERKFTSVLFGPDFWRLTREHLLLVFVSLAASIVVGIPLGILSQKTKMTQVILGVVGVIQTIPALALFAILGRQLSRRTVSPVEVPRSDLVLRDGRLYRTSGSNAFTGVMIERYDSGLLKSRSTVLDGRLQGVSEGWHTNGQLQVIEHFQAGVSDGPRIKYYPSGRKQSEGRIMAGQFNVGELDLAEAGSGDRRALSPPAGPPSGSSRAR